MGLVALGMTFFGGCGYLFSYSSSHPFSFFAPLFFSSARCGIGFLGDRMLC